MLFNLDKCKVLHVGYNNKCNQYFIENTEIQCTDDERDLGVMVHKSLKVGNQCSKVVKEAYSTLGVINRCFLNKTKEILVPLYKTLVRCRLEYCVQARRPYLVKDIELIEKVQKRMTRMLPDLRGLPYHERLKTLHLTTLETRRLRGDLIEVFKLVNGFENIDSNIFLHRASGTCRWHSEKITKNAFRLDVRKYTFSKRVINNWNALTQYVVDCTTVASFKRYLDRYITEKGFL